MRYVVVRNNYDSYWFAFIIYLVPHAKMSGLGITYLSFRTAKKQIEILVSFYF